MQCPGSVALRQRVAPGPSSPEAALGTAAHAALSHALNDGEIEPWELAGMTFEGHEVDADMLDAVEIAINVCRSLITPATSVLVEQHISHRSIEDFRGTVDFATVTSSLLNVVDYKHGEGVIVECENNPQMMYYAYGILLQYPSVRRVVLRIVQPRAHHVDGPVRRWETTAKHIREWAEGELIPAMQRAKKSTDFHAGSWCRFCPAKLVCPAMRGLFEAAVRGVPSEVKELDNAALGQSYALAGPVRMYLKAIEDETFARLSRGQEVPGTKLVTRRADRAWKDGAETIFTAAFGSSAMESPKLKSPAQMEKLSTDAKALVKQHAYVPQAGFTVALADDRRQEIKPRGTAEVFASYLGERE